jgi:hypothetical protein
MTSFGELPIKALRLRDPIRTSSGSFLPVKWVDAVHLDEAFLGGFPDAMPIFVPARSLGRDSPKENVLVSPHQKLPVGDNTFHPDQRLARDLVARPGVMRRPVGTVSYYLFHLGEPAKVMIEGLWVQVTP